MRMRRVLVAVLFSLGFPVFGSAQDWSPLQFLLGRWTTDQPRGGERAHGTGSFHFAPDLQGRILLRKNFAEYPAENGKPAYRHDDLMVVYRNQAGEIRASYFDNEGHVIEYGVTVADGSAVFLSKGPATATRYRLTYKASAVEHLNLKFEIAPPGKDFSTYIDASVHRDRSER